MKGMGIGKLAPKVSMPKTEIKAPKVPGTPSFSSRAKRPGGMAKGGKVPNLGDADALKDRNKKIMRAVAIGQGKTSQEAKADHSRQMKLIDKMAKGGKVHDDAAKDRKLIREEIARAERMEEKSEMRRGGKVKVKMPGLRRFKGFK